MYASVDGSSVDAVMSYLGVDGASVDGVVWYADVDVDAMIMYADVDGVGRSMGVVGRRMGAGVDGSGVILSGTGLNFVFTYSANTIAAMAKPAIMKRMPVTATYFFCHHN